jgi:phage terminase large subunit-like protein
MSAWPRGKDSRVQEYVVRFHNAVVGDELTHDGSSALTRHVLNARRRETRTGYLLYKAYPDSPDKIDAAYAAVMAWKARLDAVSQGIKERTGSGRRVIVMN